MTERISHSFEAGRRGKPDELDSSIAHLIGAYLLELSDDARFDLRISGTYKAGQPLVRLSGEISDFLFRHNFFPDISTVILDRYNFVHKTGLSSDDLQIDFNLKPQASALSSNGNTGDSGNPIAVAYRHGPNHLPWERYIAVAIRDIIDDIYHNGTLPEYLAEKSGIGELRGLCADGKVAVEAFYDGFSLASLASITVAVEHAESLAVEELRQNVNKIIHTYLLELSNRYDQPLGDPEIIINGAGAWNQGGWIVDEGSREAKPYRDGFATHGIQEDSFSGEDPSKPSGTGTFIARYVAVQIVVSGLADYARVALSYTIGKDDVGLNIFTGGTGTLSQEDLEAAVRSSIPLGIKDGIAAFDLRNPDLYRKIVSASDFFQDPRLPWNLARNELTNYAI